MENFGTKFKADRKCIKTLTSRNTVRYICNTNPKAAASIGNMPARPERVKEMEDAGTIRKTPAKIAKMPLHSKELSVATQATSVSLPHIKPVAESDDNVSDNKATDTKQETGVTDFKPLKMKFLSKSLNDLNLSKNIGDSKWDAPTDIRDVSSGLKKVAGGMIKLAGVAGEGINRVYNKNHPKNRAETYRPQVTNGKLNVLNDSEDSSISSNTVDRGTEAERRKRGDLKSKKSSVLTPSKNQSKQTRLGAKIAAGTKELGKNDPLLNTAATVATLVTPLPKGSLNAVRNFSTLVKPSTVAKVARAAEAASNKVKNPMKLRPVPDAIKHETVKDANSRLLHESYKREKARLAEAAASIQPNSRVTLDPRRAGLKKNEPIPIKERPQSLVVKTPLSKMRGSKNRKAAAVLATAGTVATTTPVAASYKFANAPTVTRAAARPADFGRLGSPKFSKVADETAAAISARKATEEAAYHAGENAAAAALKKERQASAKRGLHRPGMVQIGGASEPAYKDDASRNAGTTASSTDSHSTAIVNVSPDSDADRVQNVITNQASQTAAQTGNKPLAGTTTRPARTKKPKPRRLADILDDDGSYKKGSISADARSSAGSSATTPEVKHIKSGDVTAVAGKRKGDDADYTDFYSQIRSKKSKKSALLEKSVALLKPILAQVHRKQLSLTDALKKVPWYMQDEFIQMVAGGKK